MASFAGQVNAALDALKKQHASDFLIYAGAINRRGADWVAGQLEDKTSKNLILLLCTTGGDSHAAFKIARACQTAYGTVQERYKQADHPRFITYVPTLCKSAGTIIALGADEIMMSLGAELGPIDIQLRKQKRWANSRQR
jgi:membrane-bound ClpP family serine protease